MSRRTTSTSRSDGHERGVAPDTSLRGGSILRGSTALSASVLVVAAGGAVFWAIAARVASSQTVGRVAALSSSVAFLVYLAALGLIPVVARYGSGATRPERAIHNRAMLLAGLAAAVGALVIAGVSSVADVETLRSVQAVPEAIAFSLVAGGAAVTVLVEIRLLSQGRYRWIVARSVLTAVVSIGLVAFGPVGRSPLALFLAGSGVAAVSGPVVWVLSERRTADRFAIGPLPEDTRTILRYLWVSWVGSLVGRGASTAMPLVVALSVGSEDNARFFVAWNIALVMYLIVQNVGTTLLADGGRSSDLQVQTRHSIVLGAGLAAVMIAASEIGAPLVERVYGASYAESVEVLRILALATAPMVPYAVSYAVAQVRHLSGVMIGLPLLLASAVYLPLAFAGEVTVTSAAVVWLLGTSVAGVGGPLLLLRFRYPSTTPVPSVASPPTGPPILEP